MQHDNNIKEVLLTEDQIRARIAEVGKQITEDYRGKDLLVIGVLKGAWVYLADLFREIDNNAEVDFMSVSSYGGGTVSSGSLTIVKDLSVDCNGRDVLIVEDIVDSGNTLFYLGKYLMGRGASSIRIATLLDKPDRRNPEHNLTVDYHCFKIPDEFVVGYGLDFAEKYRNLPDIGVLDSRVYGAARE